MSRPSGSEQYLATEIVGDGWSEGDLAVQGRRKSAGIPPSSPRNSSISLPTSSTFPVSPSVPSVTSSVPPSVATLDDGRSEKGLYDSPLYGPEMYRKTSSGTGSLGDRERIEPGQSPGPAVQGRRKSAGISLPSPLYSSFPLPTSSASLVSPTVPSVTSSVPPSVATSDDGRSEKGLHDSPLYGPETYRMTSSGTGSLCDSERGRAWSVSWSYFVFRRYLYGLPGSSAGYRSSAALAFRLGCGGLGTRGITLYRGPSPHVG